jgi:hypothetical protein
MNVMRLYGVIVSKLPVMPPAEIRAGQGST